MVRKLRKPSKRLLAELTANKRRRWCESRLKKQGGKCYWCGARILKDATADHLIPLSRGGEDHYENVVAAHKWCNNHKADRTPEEFCEPGSYRPVPPHVRKALASIPVK